MDYSEPGYDSYPVGNSALGAITTERAAAGLVFGAMLFLFLVRRGFRGISVPGVGGVGLG